ncbi:MAG TPA: DUF1553 domain-containing protein, partial [Verrucomicrobiae bacterium]|nr:DUF1553 domain-containing protein [Verrucomicrobiae bacterium]
FVIGDTIAASERAIEDARKDRLKLAVAEARHATLMAVLSAEQREKSSPEWKAEAEKACMAQRKQKLAEAKLAVNEAEAATKKEPTADSAKKAAQAYKSLYDAEEKLTEPPSTEFKSRSEDNYPAKSSGRRLALARWIASPENPLTARVAVNHIWLRHFGRGIVATPENFGRSGSRPSHPELLDWLAAEFMARGWSMKAIHRLILTSAAYRMASTPDERNATIDPDNIYLWRMPSRRMEAELIRDNVLYVSGSLDPAMGGPDIDNAAGLTSRRRSVYLRIAAEKEVEFLTVFDGPNATECYQRRPTVLPQQALALANSELGFKQAKLLTAQLPCDESFIPAAFERILARAPNADELRLCGDFVKDDKSREHLVLVLFNHTDFVTIR